MIAALAVLLIGISRGVTFRSKFAVVFVAGLIGTLFITIGDPVWFHLPWDYTAGVALYELVAWAILGATTAAVTRRTERA